MDTQLMQSSYYLAIHVQMIDDSPKMPANAIQLRLSI